MLTMCEFDVDGNCAVSWCIDESQKVDLCRDVERGDIQVSCVAHILEGIAQETELMQAIV